MAMRAMKFVLPVTMFLFAPAAQAFPAAVPGNATAIITQNDIDSILNLIRFRDIHVRIHDRSVLVIPSASVRYLGVKKQEFPLNADWIMKLVNLKFHDIEALESTIRLTENGIELRIHFEDYGTELKSWVGT